MVIKKGESGLNPWGPRRCGPHEIESHSLNQQVGCVFLLRLHCPQLPSPFLLPFGSWEGSSYVSSLAGLGSFGVPSVDERNE